MGMKRPVKSPEEILELVKLLDEGKGLRYILRNYGIGFQQMIDYQRRYHEGGLEALKLRHTNYTGEIKQQIVRDIWENEITLLEAAKKYNVNIRTIEKWHLLASHEGIDALLIFKKQGRPPKDMGRPKKKALEEMTELERLRYENEYLRAENALLKKVKALVEEEERRQREAGRKPSKN